MKWKWSVLPSEEKDWGLPVIEPVPAPVVTSTVGPTVGKKDPSVPAGPSILPGDYEVKKGDALANIANAAAGEAPDFMLGLQQASAVAHGFE